MIVAIPSKGRPTGVKTAKILRSAFVFVPAYEEKAYQAAGVANVVPVPKEVRGITRTRNWILDWAKDRDDGARVVMIDDDVKVQGWVELRATSSKNRTMTESEWVREWTVLFDVTEQMGFRIWGTATQNALRAIYPWKPILERSYITASCMGMLNPADGSGIRFDERFPVKEDYEMGLRCIKEDGGVLAARYVHWSNSHWKDAGGCADYRTQGMELEAIRRLRRMYPGMIRRVTRGGSEYSIDLDFPTS